MMPKVVLPQLNAVDSGGKPKLLETNKAPTKKKLAANYEQNSCTRLAISPVAEYTVTTAPLPSARIRSLASVELPFLHHWSGPIENSFELLTAPRVSLECTCLSQVMVRIVTLTSTAVLLLQICQRG